MSDQYINLDQLYEVEIGLYSLWRYAGAQNRYERLVAKREVYFQHLYDDISPSLIGMDYETGKVYTKKTSAEDSALRIIAEKEMYDARIRREKRKADLFAAAMMTLDPREWRTIQIKYQGAKHDEDFHSNPFQEEVTSAEKKLIEFLTTELQKEADETIKELRDELRERIMRNPFLKGNE